MFSLDPDKVVSDRLGFGHVVSPRSSALRGYCANRISISEFSIGSEYHRENTYHNGLGSDGFQQGDWT